MTEQGRPAGDVLDRSPVSDLADVVETVLDKGVVIDAQVQVGVLGIQLAEINARVVIASVETYLSFAEAVDRLEIGPAQGQQQSLPDLVGGLTRGLGDGLDRATQTINGAAREVSDDFGAERGRSSRSQLEKE